MSRLRKRDPVARSIDYMIAYGAGPAKLSAIPVPDLIAAGQRWATLNIAAIEAALENHCDEEGCGAVFATLRVHLWDTV